MLAQVGVMGNPADANQGLLVISEDMIIRGVKAAQLPPARDSRLVEGDVTAGAVKTGKCYGSIDGEIAEVPGTLQGNVTVRNLIDIRLRFGPRQRLLRQARC